MNNEHSRQWVETIDYTGTPYTQSTVVHSLVDSRIEDRPLRIAFADIDSTMTGNPKYQQAAYDELRNAGYCIVFVTSRTAEMTIGSIEAKKSPELKRPSPKLKKEIKFNPEEDTIDSIRETDAKFSNAWPDEVPSFAGIYNGDATLAATGSEIWIRQLDNSYIPDLDFNFQMNVDIKTWREETISKINTVIECIGFGASYAPLEDINLFKSGRMDVAPPDLRIQMNFISIEYQLEFMRKINCQFPELRIIEDGNPEDGRFQIYITPQRAGKEIAVDNFFQKILIEMNKKLSDEKRVLAKDFHIVYFGDSWPDVPMGLYGAEGTNAILLLVGGSRLAPLIGDQRKKELQFASENITAINDKIIPLSQIGYYQIGDRVIIVGDEAYPETKGPQSIIAHLNSINTNRG